MKLLKKNITKLATSQEIIINENLFFTDIEYSIALALALTTINLRDYQDVFEYKRVRFLFQMAGRTKIFGNNFYDPKTLFLVW